MEKNSLLLPLVVLFLVQVSFNVAQPDLPISINSDRFKEAVEALFPSNIVRQLPPTQLDDLKRASPTRCLKQLILLQEGLMKGAWWALKMIDASSKMPSGILMGNRKDLGMYDECVTINVVEDHEELRGRHCMYNVSIESGANLMFETLSICVPAACHSGDIQEMLNITIEVVASLVGMDVSISGVTCSPVEPREWTTGGIVTLFGFGALLLFLIICTICDIVLIYSIGKSKSRDQFVVIRQFSFYSNGLRLLSTKTSPQTLPAIQGVRFFSMCWVILGHEYFMHLLAPSANLVDMREWVSSWQSLYIMVAPFAVDTFFTMSGFLMSYLFLKEMSTGRTFNILAYYLHRYLRLTPAFAALILITIFILPRVGSGPVWESNMAHEEELCRISWWSMLLYVHNYVNKACLLHTWYLAVEMQYFWLSPIVLYPLARKPKIGLVILAVCFIAAITTPAVITYKNKYTSAIFPNGAIDNTMGTVLNFYMATHNRAGAWLMGVFFGYLVFTQKGPSTKTTKWIGWLLTVAAFVFCVISMRKFQEKGYEYNVVWETFYVAVARPFWSAAVAWIIYACVLGFGGPLTTILSLSIFHPLSRLSYSVYLVHFVIQTAKASATRIPRFFSNFAAFDFFLSDLLLSTIIAYGFSLVFESPILVLEKLVKEWSRTDVPRKVLTNEEVENGTDNAGQTAH